MKNKYIRPVKCPNTCYLYKIKRYYKLKSIIERYPKNKSITGPTAIANVLEYNILKRELWS